jgi:ubiquinone biosynthesis protein UbiJ
MEARVQILPLDRPTVNGYIYSRAVIEDALSRLNGQTLVVTHVNSFLNKSGVPTMADSLGVASALEIDNDTNMLMAHVNIPVIPEDLANGYVIRSAGFGTLDGMNIAEFTLSAVIIAAE